MDAIHTPGRFVWRELYVKDVKGARDFFHALLGWEVAEMDMGRMVYQMLMSGEHRVGGIMPLAAIKMPDVPPHWISYVSVESVDDTTRRAVSAKGKALVQPEDTPPVGRLSVIQDPQGAVLSLWRGTQGDPPAGERPAPGTFCWEELITSDVDGACAFYKQLLGWTSEPFGEPQSGIRVFKLGDTQVATVMAAPKGVPSHWMSYICVPSLAEVRGKVKRLGGKVLVEEISVPNIGRFAVITDKEGATVALFEPSM